MHRLLINVVLFPGSTLNVQSLSGHISISISYSEERVNFFTLLIHRKVNWFYGNECFLIKCQVAIVSQIL